MSNKLPSASKIIKRFSFQPLTKERWNDYVKLFGEKGACGGCWCMYWRLKRSEYEKNKGSGNKRLMHQQLNENKIPGLLMYADKDPIGWCSFGPREDFPVLNNSRILKPVDDKEVWSIVCFYIDKRYRRMGLSEAFLKYIVDYCKKQKAKIIEGYPLDVSNKDYPAVFAFTGLSSAYLRVGFKEVSRRSETRPIMRYEIN